MIEGICRVCGAGLAAPIVRCPACDTPHHQDCWEYNRGCSIYGCSPALTIKAVTVTTPADLVIVAPAPPAETDRLRKVSGAGAGAFGFVWWLLGFELAFKLALPALAVWFAYEQRRAQRLENEALEPGRDPREALDLERKAVAALIGSRVPDQLAQSYALFEQRHPRGSLPGGAQEKAALELIDHGYWALGLEALDKALRAAGANRAALETAQRQALLKDPAYLMDALAGPGQPVAGAARDHADRLHSLRDVPPGDGPFYLLALASTGWTGAERPPVLLPSHCDGPQAVPAHRLAVAHDRGAAAAELTHRWLSGQPCIALPASELALPPLVEEVLEIHLSQKEARFCTAVGERIVEWRDIRNVVFARLEKVEVKRDTTVVPESGGRMSYAMRAEVSIKELVDSRPVIEVHYGPGPTRLRLDQPRPDLFNYLGRRRELSHAANMALAAKDLARFGPGIRVSHGLSALFAERSGPGLRFAGADLLEEYILWFWAMGTDSVRQRWVPVQEAFRL